MEASAEGWEALHDVSVWFACDAGMSEKWGQTGPVQAPCECLAKAPELAGARIRRVIASRQPGGAVEQINLFTHATILVCYPILTLILARFFQSLLSLKSRPMPTLITPRDLPTWVPGRIMSASDGLGWRDVGHRAYLYTGLDVPIPPMDHFMVVRYRRGQTPMDRRVEGRWTRKRCTPGDFSLLTRSEHSHWHWTECINVSHTYLSEALMSRVATDITERPVSEVRLHDVLQAHDPVVTGIVNAITAEAECRGLGGSLCAESLAIQLAVHLFRKYAAISFREDAPVGPLSPTRMRRLEEYVDAHLHEGITIEQMAETVGLGVWTFSRHFRATTGASPYDFVTRRRLERAVRLLATSGRAIKEVAAACGFADQAHLTRMMRARMGTTPARLRKDGCA